jgi:hypothetical protein
MRDEAFEVGATQILGGIGFVFIAFMAATSNDGAVRTLGRARWSRLHRFFLYYLWFIITATYLRAAARDRGTLSAERSRSRRSGFGSQPGGTAAAGRTAAPASEGLEAPRVGAARSAARWSEPRAARRSADARLLRVHGFARRGGGRR